MTGKKNRANDNHWTTYIHFLNDYPCMVNNPKHNGDVWSILSSRLNAINGCRKSVEKWKKSITNWRNSTIKKHNNGKTLSVNENDLIRIIRPVDNGKNDATNANVKRKQPQNPNGLLHHAISVPVTINPIYERNAYSNKGQERHFQLIDRETGNGGIQETSPRHLLKSLCVYYQNVRGLRTKWETFCDAVIQENYDIIVLTETWLIPAISSHSLFDYRYTVFRTDRLVQKSGKLDGGGVLIAVSKKHGTVKRYFTNTSLEEVWVSLVNYNLCIGAVYFPQRASTNTVKEFLQSAKMIENNRNSIILGDFNMRRIPWTKNHRTNECIPGEVTLESYKTLLDGMKMLGVEQRNNIVNKTGVILDLVYSNTNLISVSKTDSPFVRPDYHHPPLKVSLVLKDTKPEGG